MIRSSKHSVKFANSGKKASLLEFLIEYNKAVQIAIDYIWINKFSYKEFEFDIEKDLLDLPKYINYKDAKYTGKLSARAFCSAMNQATGIVRSNITKRK